MTQASKITPKGVFVDVWCFDIWGDCEQAHLLKELIYLDDIESRYDDTDKFWAKDKPI